MSRDNQVIIGVDTSYEEGLVVVFNEQSVLWSYYLKNKMQHAIYSVSIISQAYDWLISQGYVLKGLATGLGPGSFVGSRIALASALGFALGKNVALVGVCSHFALSYEVDNNDAMIMVIMKAAGDLAYVSKYQNNHRLGDIKVEKLTPFDESCIIISDINQVVSNNKLSVFCNGVKEKGFFKAFNKNYQISNLKDQSLFIKPNYIKEVNIYSKSHK